MDISDIRKVYGARTPGVIGRHRFYSVLVPFYMAAAGDRNESASVDMNQSSFDPELSLLYEVRSGSVSQPGEICFPGGHVEEGETPEECAVRETCEELGIPAGAIDIIGQGDTICGNGNFTLYTFIGELKAEGFDDGNGAVCDLLSMLKPDPEEVAEVFALPVESLMNSRPEHYGEKMTAVVSSDFPYEKVGIDRNYPWRTPANDIPVYDIDGRIIWGLTGRITENVIDTIRDMKR